MHGGCIADGQLPRAGSTGIPSLNSRDAETGGAVSESGCSISTLLLYQGESQNLVHTQMWCSTPGKFFGINGVMSRDKDGLLACMVNYNKDSSESIGVQ